MLNFENELSFQVICANGTFLTSSYEEGGECERLTFAKFVKSDTEVDGDSSTASNPWSAPGGIPPTSIVSSGKALVPPMPPSSSATASAGLESSESGATNSSSSSRIVAKKLEEINTRNDK